MSHEITENNCPEFESRINDLLDARRDLAEDELLIRHADRCANCKFVLEDYLALDDTLSNIVWDSETLAQLSSPTSVSRPNPMWWSASLAAALLIALNMIFGSSPPGQDSTDAKLLSIAKQIPIVKPLSQSDLEKRQQFESQSIVQVTNEPKINPLPWNELSERLHPVLNPYYQISAELPGIRPIQSSLYLTIDWVQAKILKLSSNRQSKQGFGQQHLRLNVPIA